MHQGWSLTRELTVSESGKGDLIWWIKNILSTEKNITAQTNPNMILRCDASKQGDTELNNARTGGRWLLEEANRSTNELELEAAIFFALQSLCRDTHFVHIRAASDNATAVCYVNNIMGSNSRRCNATARQNMALTALYLQERSILLSANKEPLTFNDRTEWKQFETVFSDCISELWGPLDVNLFISALNKQIPYHVSWRPETDVANVDAL